MKNAGDYDKKFSALMRRIRTKHRVDPPESAEPATQLIGAFMEWNTSRRNARGALRRMLASVVDINELRVCHPHELEAMIGDDYPQLDERVARMHDSLNEIFAREQAASLDSLHRRGKKEARGYLDTLPGMTPYVAAHVTLVSFDGHAVPVDDQLAELLRSFEVVDPKASLAEIESFLERRVKADNALETHATLMAWVDAGIRRATLAQPAAKTRQRTKTKSTTKRKAKAAAS